MKKSEMRREIAASLVAKLRDGAFNAHQKGELDQEQYDLFCQVELEVADRIEKTFGIGRKAGAIGDEAYAEIVRRYEEAGDHENANIIRAQWDVAKAARRAT